MARNQMNAWKGYRQGGGGEKKRQNLGGNGWRWCVRGTEKRGKKGSNVSGWWVRFRRKLTSYITVVELVTVHPKYVARRMTQCASHPSPGGIEGWERCRRLADCLRSVGRDDHPPGERTVRFGVVVITPARYVACVF